MSNDEDEYIEEEEELEYRIRTFGRKINKEKPGYTDVDYDGIARPVLKIPADIPKGRRRLTAVYTDERRKTHAPSLARTIVIYGSKAYIHCPTIYHPIDAEEITLFANIFSNNRPVPGGYAIFKLQNLTLSQDRLEVSGGYVEETFNIPVKVNKTYQCPYEGSEHYQISEARGEGVVIVYKERRTPLVVEVLRVIANENEAVKLVARVYRRVHETVVNFPDDIPESGNITFYIDGEVVSYHDNMNIPIDKNGFATIPIIANQGIGVHQIDAIYNPDTPEMKLKYDTTFGSNTLFIGNDTNRPALAQNGLNCGVRNKPYVFSFSTNRELNGKVRLFIDGSSVAGEECTQNGNITFFGNTLPLFEQEVIGTNNFTFTITIPNYNALRPNDIWGYSGNHNMIIEYIEYDEKLGDMEYWWVWNDFYVQIDTEINIDTTFYDNTFDEGQYTGNNRYIRENNEITHYTPTEEEIEPSVLVGNPLKINVKNVDDGSPITKGKVKVKITSRIKRNEEE